MPTKITRSSAPSAERVRTPGMNSRDVTPLSITALSIIAILVVVLHVATGAVLGHPQAHASVVVQGDEATCPADAMPPVPSLPFD
jgi:hypothetical protein